MLLSGHDGRPFSTPFSGRIGKLFFCACEGDAFAVVPLARVGIFYGQANAAVKLGEEMGTPLFFNLEEAFASIAQFGARGIRVHVEEVASHLFLWRKGIRCKC